ncbi:DUF3185 domain-containing protein [Leuconostoc pseudomesenteroides]|uniref:DUF3185 domain-containing protein n=1 Tax=Leuconostoc pseudomesenteroides TaxID=33968 RepID=UPI0022869533|nr:DUF3185 domain-containing protein [Leuconostoc pseudomesenteroides]WAM37649.1 DUF3185 domain-containing protein [Leuconostoc pseudomesenteroides]
MKKKKMVYILVRVILGLILFSSGATMIALGGKAPVTYDALAAQNFIQAFQNSGYFFYFLGIVKVAVGLTLIINKYVSLALVVLMPISINMVLFHLFLMPSTGFPAYTIFLLNVYLMLMNISNYRDLIRP